MPAVCCCYAYRKGEVDSPCGASPLRPAGDAPAGRSDQPSAFLFLPWRHPFSPTGLSFSSSSFSRLFLLSSLPDNLSYGMILSQKQEGAAFRLSGGARSHLPHMTCSRCSFVALYSPGRRDVRIHPGGSQDELRCSFFSLPSCSAYISSPENIPGAPSRPICSR